MLRKFVVSRSFDLLVVLLVAGCPESDSGDEGADPTEGSTDAEGGATEAVPSSETDDAGDSARSAESEPAADDAGRRPPCGADGTSSYVSGEQCVCFSGFSWCVPDDPADLTCCAMGGEPDRVCTHLNSELVEGRCVCDSGYQWCSDDPSDLTCCRPQ